MQKSLTLLITAPVIEAPMLRLSGLPESSRVLVTLCNTSGVNDATYKFQESADGVSWANKVFTTESGNVVTFNLLADTTHPFKVDMIQPHLRLLLSGDADILVSAQYNIKTTKDEETQMFL